MPFIVLHRLLLEYVFLTELRYLAPLCGTQLLAGGGPSPTPSPTKTSLFAKMKLLLVAIFLVLCMSGVYSATSCAAGMGLRGSHAACMDVANKANHAANINDDDSPDSFLAATRRGLKSKPAPTPKATATAKTKTETKPKTSTPKTKKS